jgi:two-component system cell cycle sensor histidine kinase/response regulator CckA
MPPADHANEFELLATLVQKAPIGFAIVDRDFRYVRVNDVLAAMNGIAAEDHTGRLVREVVPALWPPLEPMYRSVLRGDTVIEHELSGPSPRDPTALHHYLVSFYPVRHSGEIAGVGIIVNDVTDRERVRQQLRSRTDLYAMLARANRAVSECRTRDALFEEICGLAVDTGHFRFACIGVPDGDHIRLTHRAGDDEGYMERITVSVAGDNPHGRGPGAVALRTGERVILNDFLGSPLTAPWHEEARRVGFRSMAALPFFSRGQVTAVLALYSEQVGFFTPELVNTLSEMQPSVSFALDALQQEDERRRHEDELQLRDRAIRAVMQGICITDAQRPDNPIIYATPGFESMTGYSAEEVLGWNYRFLHGPDTDLTAVREIHDAIAGGRKCTVEFLNYRKDGSSFWNELALSPVFDERGILTNFVGVQTDVTERRQRDQQLRQSQKMEAVGQLASGVAHDFNNLLTVIDGCTELLISEMPAGAPQLELLGEILAAGERAGKLTRQLLTFSRKQVVAPQVLNLNDVARDSEKMLRRLIGENVILTLDLAPNLPPVRVDPGQFEQVLINLAVNARDSISGSGTLTIATGAEVITHPRDGVPIGDCVTVTVTDTGSGMDAATLARMFDPFFTTKRTGKGTGLGLSTVRSIIDAARGTVSARSEPGKGTRFTVYLPRETAPYSAEPPRLVPGVMPRGSETILLVEDDDAVRALGRHILTGCGYHVLEASDGSKALDTALQYDSEIHLLLSDVVMPHLGGRMLSEAVVAMRPQCRVLFLSGYNDDDVLRHGVVESEVEFLQKPYTPALLAQKVRTVLDSDRR